MSPATIAKTDVIIVGAGVSGIAVAYHLPARDIGFVILEADEDVGGTWLRNKWHGARVDSEVVRYAFSFMLEIPCKELWNRGEVLDYLMRTLQVTGIDRHLMLRTRVQRATFDIVAIVRETAIVSERYCKVSHDRLVDRGYHRPPSSTDQYAPRQHVPT